AEWLCGETSAWLRERGRPGTTLGAARPGPDRDEVVASLLRRLWRPAPAGSGFRPLQSMCDMWADEAEAKMAAGGRPPGLDPGLIRAGLDRFRELPASAAGEVVLCTDLHGGNILAAEREPWLVIDPKPYVGAPPYDPLHHTLNC